MIRTVRSNVAVPLAALATGSVVSLLIGVYGAQHEPTFRSLNTFGFGSMIQMKVWFSLAVGVLAVGQLIGALWIYGRPKQDRAGMVLATRGRPAVRRPHHRRLDLGNLVYRRERAAQG